MPLKPDYPKIEIRGFKWPRRPMANAVTRLIGEDSFGRWLGITRGDPWWTPDRTRSGVFEQSFVKVIPDGTFWTACFNAGDPVVDVDIVQPVRWLEGALEEVDLELDILRLTDGSVHVRDRDEFNRVRMERKMTDEVATEAEAACERIHALVKGGAEPFATVGHVWLARFLAELGAEN